MSTGSYALVSPGSVTLTGTDPVTGKTVAVAVVVTAPATLDHLDYTLSSGSSTVGGSAPTGTVTKWQDGGETTPFTGSVSLSYTSSNTAVATINSSSGVITLVAAGSCTFTVTDSISSKTATTGTLTVSAAGSYAYNSVAPLGTALVSDQPSDYANLAGFTSNALSRYRTNPSSSAFTFDSTNQWNGNPTLATDLTHQAYPQLKIPSASSQTDLVYHVRRRMRGAELNDPVVPVGQSRGAAGPSGSGQWSCLLGLQFDPTVYAVNGSSYGIDAYRRGITLDISMTTTSSSGPQYRVSAGITRASDGALLSDSTSNSGDATTSVGDEWFDNNWYDFFLRVQRGTTGGSTPCLFVSAYYGPQGTAPKQIGNTVTLTMLDSSTPPMPTHAILEPELFAQATTSLLAPATFGSLTAFQQLIDNAGHPNTALDFTSVTAWGAHGSGHRAVGWGERTWDMARYSSDAAFKADNNKRFLLNDATHLTWTAADAGHKGMPYLRYTWPAGVSADPCVYDQTPNNTRPTSSEVWLREFVKFAPHFTTNGGNAGASTGYKMWQLANASGGSVQRLELTCTSVGGASTHGSSELYAYVPGGDTSVFDSVLSASQTAALVAGGTVSFAGSQITATIPFAAMPEFDVIAPIGDGTDNRDGLTRVFTFHAKNYFDGALGTSGRWVRLWEMFIAFDGDSAPFFRTGWAAVFNDGQTPGSVQYLNDVDWGENRNQPILYDSYIDRWGAIARDGEQFGSDPFGVLAARASAAPKPVYSVVNKTNAGGGTVVNTVKLFPLTTQIVPVIDGVDQSPVSVTCNDGVLTSVDVTHTGQASGTHTYNYKTKNANGTTSPTAGNLTLTVP